MSRRAREECPGWGWDARNAGLVPSPTHPFPPKLIFHPRRPQCMHSSSQQCTPHFLPGPGEARFSRPHPQFGSCRVFLGGRRLLSLSPHPLSLRLPRNSSKSPRPEQPAASRGETRSRPRLPEIGPTHSDTVTAGSSKMAKTLFIGERGLGYSPGRRGQGRSREGARGTHPHGVTLV